MALMTNEPTAVQLSDGSSIPIIGLGTGANGLTPEKIRWEEFSLLKVSHSQTSIMCNIAALTKFASQCLFAGHSCVHVWLVAKSHNQMCMSCCLKTIFSLTAKSLQHK